MAIISSRHNKSFKPISLEEIESIRKDLIGVVEKIELIENIELGGGLAAYLAMELHTDAMAQVITPLFPNNGIVRMHHAFHLNVYEKQLKALEKHLTNVDSAGNHYKLATRTREVGLFFNKKRDTYKFISAEEALQPTELLERPKNLRFLRIDQQGIIASHKTRLDYLDIYPYQLQNWDREAVEPWHGGKFYIPGEKRTFSPAEVYVAFWDTHEKDTLRLPLNLYRGEKYSLKNGLLVSLASPRWIRHVKEKRRSQDAVDRQDIANINAFLRLTEKSL